MSVFRAFYLGILLLTFVPTILAVSLDTEAGNILEGCVTNYDPNTDYFPDKIGSFHGDLFSVTYFNSYKLVNVTSLQYHFSLLFILYQCGTPIPTGYASYEKYPVPMTRLGSDETTDATFLELLGMRTKIDVLASPDLFTSPCIQQLVANGTIKALSSNETIAAQQIASLDVYFTDAYYWDSAYYSTPPPSPHMPVDVSDEHTPLKRADWLEYFSIFVNQEAAASTILTAIQMRYNCHAHNAQIYASQGRPLAANVIIYGNTYFSVSVAPYMISYITDGGGSALVPSTGSPSGSSVVFNTLSELLNAISNVDVIFDGSYPSPANWTAFLTLYGLTDSSAYKFVTSGNVYTTDRLQNPGGHEAWFESALAQPDVVLRDFVHALQPNYPLVNDTVYLRKLKNPAQSVNILTASQCTNAAAPLPLMVDECVMLTPTPSPTPTTSGTTPSGAGLSTVLMVVLVAIAAGCFIAV